MGLDAVELIMVVESAFDIQIENSPAEKLLTPGQLIDYVLSKVANADASVCLTHRAFNLVRLALVRHAGLQRGQIMPEANLAELIPKARRRRVLKALAAELGTGAFPRLRRPAALRNSLSAISVVLGAATAIWVNAPAFVVSLLIAVVTALCVGFGVAAITRPFSTEFPPDLSNIASLSRWVMTHKPDLALPPQKAWTRDQVAQRVREIVIENLNCGPQYREDAKFVEELGLY